MLASFTECRAPISSILMTKSWAFAVKQLSRAAAANSFSVFIYLYFFKIPGLAGDKVLWQDVNILIFFCFPKPFDPDIFFSSTAAVTSSFIPFPSVWPGTIDNEQHFSSLPYFFSDSTYLRTVKQYDDAIMAKNFFKSYIWRKTNLIYRL